MILWTDEQNAMLTKLYAAGLSFSMIVDAINGHFGTSFTRNAAIGRVHRMDLPPRPSPIKEKPKARETVKHLNVSPLRKGDGYKPKIVDVASLDIRLVDLEPHHCRYACTRIDNEWRFCGRPKKSGSSFCADHHALCWNPRVAPTQQRPIYRERRSAA